MADKNPVMASQPGMAAPPPGYTEQAQHPQSQLFRDQLFCSKLDVIKNYEIRQANVLLEGVTLGIWANTYVIGDLDRPTPVLNYKDGNTMQATPVFLVREESNCCCRMLCPGNQPLTAKVFHAQPSPVAGDTLCGIYRGSHSLRNHSSM